MNETVRLASYVCDLAYDAIPSEVINKAKDSVLDTIAVGLYGSTKPWSHIVVALMKESGGSGSCSVLGQTFKISAGAAALANGTMIHAFELDNSRQPNAGSHPGATIVPALLAVSEEIHATGRNFLTALVAGCEVMFRIGLSLGQGAEKKGVHLPGLTGTFGAAAAVGKMLGLDVQEMTSAFGISGSLSSGLLEFAKAKTGGMIKRLHLGRAAEGGVLAAKLARRGFAGPDTVLEGEYGFCRVYSNSPRLEKLTGDLGRSFETLNIGMKRYPCHSFAHAPIDALKALVEEHGFRPEDVEKIVVAGEERLITHHAIHEPRDVMSAQYSVPYSLALALWKDPQDPASFSERNLADPVILDSAKKVELRVDKTLDAVTESRGSAIVTVRLKSGAEVRREVIHYRGTPANPMSQEEIRRKVEILARAVLPPDKIARLIEGVRCLEEIRDMEIVQGLIRN